MARRQHHNSISLFPFLAVLVCAMGSLILLLLVMTRKIRHDQQDVDSAAVVAAAEIPDRSSEIADLETQIKLAQAAVLTKQAEADALRTSIAERQTQITNARLELESLQAQLEASGGTEEIGVSETLKNARQLKAKEAALLRQLKESERLLFEKQQLLTEATNATQEAELFLKEKHSALISLRAQVQDAQQKTMTVSGTSTLLEFSNSTGTTRTPIVIDVSEKGFEILPNGICITPAEMEGFPVRDNPLLSAILTAHRYRSGNSVIDEPYVLLLVRPDGSLPFYAAQRVLMESSIHYGYELLDPEKSVVTKEGDPAEIPAIRAAIGDALKRRENMYAKLMAIAQQRSDLPGGSGELQTGAGERRLTVRPDGRVQMDEGPTRRPLDGRFYAGGVAPPPTLRKNRPVGAYRGLDPNRLTPEDAEKLADEFAERYVKQQQSARASAASIPAPHGLRDSVTDASEEFARNHAEQKFAEAMFGGNGGNGDSQPYSQQSRNGSESASDSSSVSQSPDSHPNPEESLFAGTTTSSSDSQSTASDSFISSLATVKPGSKQEPADDIPMSPAESLLLSGDQSAQNGPGAGQSGDASRLDHDLAQQLKSGKKQSGSLATPVGITVFLDQHHMTVGQQTAVQLDPDTLDAAFAQLLTGINEEVNDAKKNPDEPVMPIVKFVVSPGGERWRVPLARSLKQSGLRSATIYELTPYMISQDNSGRARLETESTN